MASVKRPLKLGFLQRDQIRMRQDHGIGQMTPCQDQQKESWPLGGIRPEWETEHESQGGTWKAVRVDFVFSYIDPATVSKKPQRKGSWRQNVLRLSGSVPGQERPARDPYYNPAPCELVAGVPWEEETGEEVP